MTQDRTARCKVCQKRFEVLSDEWVYCVTRKGKRVPLCSYTCWRNAESGKKQSKPPVRVFADKREEIKNDE